MEFSALIDLTVYIARAYPIEDRRYCFELATLNENMILQAESDEVMIKWLECIEGCKAGITTANLSNESLSVLPTFKSSNSLAFDMLVSSPPNADPCPSPRKNQEFHDLNIKSVPASDELLTCKPLVRRSILTF